MSRKHQDWLTAFMDYASYGEAPRHMYFWAGVSAVAGALRRKVWIDQAYFKWYPNFYVILVAPPGIVSKSTTAGISMSLLRKVPGVNFGPDVVTWPALVSAFAEKAETFEHKGEFHVMSALTLESSEFGNLLNPQDKEMVDLLVNLWDGKPGTFEKKTKHSGNDSVENPWINLIACTTPSWIAGNFPEYMIGGGFTSRCIFVYADKKAKHVAYPGLAVPADLEARAEGLRLDLEHISTLAGEYVLSPKAVQWGEAWYTKHYSVRSANLDDDRFGGYVARKQTHIHKLAMVLAASSSDELCITDEHLAIADQMVTDLEPDMQFVFSKIGKSETALYAERLIWFVHSKGKVPYTEAYRYVHSHFPSMRDFEDVLTGCVRAGYLKLEQVGTQMHLIAAEAMATAANMAGGLPARGGGK
jgi:hypothetical protein